MRQTAQRAAAERQKSEAKEELQATSTQDSKEVAEEEGDFYVPKFTYSSVPTQRGGKSSTSYFESKHSGDDDDTLSVASNEEPAGNVAVSVLETVLGVSQGDAMEESCYVVEYDSD